MIAPLLTAQLPGILADFSQISLVYMFGSQVSGDTGPMSDVDVAILCDFGAPGDEIQPAFAHALTMVLDTDRIDVLLLRQAPIELAYHVIADGKVLYQRDVATRVEYEAYVMGRYFDYLPVLRAQREQILQGGAHDRRIQRYREALRRTERTLGKTGADEE